MMNQQKATTAHKRELGQLDDLISHLDSDTIPRLLSVLNQYNASMKNPAKRPKLDSSASSDHSSIDLETYVADISAILDEVQAQQQVQQQQIQQIGHQTQTELKPVDAAKTTIHRQMQRSGDLVDLEKSIEATLGEQGELSPPPPAPENDENVRKFVRLANNKVIPMSEYRTILRQNQQPVPTKVAPSTPPQTPPSQEDVRKRESATMLVMLQSGEQRLITFTLPKESCTVREVLDQVGVPMSTDSNVQCISNPVADIDYFVTVGIPTAAENMLKCMLAAQKTIKQKTVYTQTTAPPKAKSPEPLAKQEPPPKYVRGLLAVCSYCGCCSMDHALCQRCKSPFVGGYKTVPTSSQPVTPDVKDKESDQLDKAKLGLERQQAAEMVKTEGGNDASKDGKKTSLPCKEMAPLRFEPTVTEEMKAAEVVVRRDITKVTQMLKFTCRTIQIGSHKYEPTKKVVITVNGIQIVAPNVERPNKQVKLNIQAGELYRLVYHFSKTISVIFLHTVTSCGAYIRDSLGMGLPSKKRPYYNPSSDEGHFKRIVLVLSTAPEFIDRQLKEVIENGKLEEINLADAKELLWCSVPRVAESSRR